ncbi:hypothetical protein EYB53_024815 [Candidatus Chloroploca sp. M-50]|uniref:Uncharacterized protein n=1 Tax=Candidatus Chloroploca mongolica TaxID=2528176 RepID=A0ABS4DHN4_9CHLR|nr:hypothetical protein [Candidatus Chloroploca mongolica]MBP1468954.1 hypothetical protein [Candidatus Chloroploca mongolica]
MSEDRVVVRTLTPHTRALYEAGKKLIVDSADVGREFCKFMITTSIGAIPIYLALLEFSGIKAAMPTLAFWPRVLLWSPALCFTLAALLFMVGYFPKTGEISLDIVEEIVAQRERLLTRQMQWIMMATTALMIGILGSVFTFFLLP